jgi:3-phosphoshikimate 1-carboxyvinyltransferase
MDGKKGNITVQRAPLQAFEVDASNCPDLFPILAVLAAFCQGKSRMAGVSRLANKESDRAKAILEMLTQMGVQACIEGDELVVEGHSLAERLLGGSPIRSVVTGDQSVVTGDQSVMTGDQSVVTGDQSGVPCEAPGLLKGGAYTSHHDHRMVMALKVASLGADSPITIDDEACVAKSFPQFNDLFVNCMR